MQYFNSINSNYFALLEIDFQRFFKRLGILILNGSNLKLTEKIQNNKLFSGIENSEIRLLMAHNTQAYSLDRKPL